VKWALIGVLAGILKKIVAGAVKAFRGFLE